MAAPGTSSGRLSKTSWNTLVGEIAVWIAPRSSAILAEELRRPLKYMSVLMYCVSSLMKRLWTLRLLLAAAAAHFEPLVKAKSADRRGRQRLNHAPLMAPCLVLVRHGPSAHRHDGGMVSRDGMMRWRETYDRSGIRAGRPPTWLTHLAGQAKHVVASDLPRAVMTAEALVPARTVITSELLRESPLAIPRWPTRLPVPVWDGLVHVCWSCRILRGTDVSSAEQARAAAAADWLSTLVAHDRSTAVVVTHGVFRRLLTKQLVARRWSGQERRAGYAPWSAWTYSVTRTAQSPELR